MESVEEFKVVNALVEGNFDAISICKTKLRSNAVEEWNGIKCVGG